jgi:hypothetical protein
VLPSDSIRAGPATADLRDHGADESDYLYLELQTDGGVTVDAEP